MRQTNDRHDDDLHAEVVGDMAAPATHAAGAQPKKRSRASYDLREETIERINALARQLEVNKYVVAQRLLDYALQAVEDGDLKLERVPVVRAWGLR